jgi:hypothetical protein
MPNLKNQKPFGNQSVTVKNNKNKDQQGKGNVHRTLPPDTPK